MSISILIRPNFTLLSATLPKACIPLRPHVENRFQIGDWDSTNRHKADAGLNLPNWPRPAESEILRAPLICATVSLAEVEFITLILYEIPIILYTYETHFARSK